MPIYSMKEILINSENRVLPEEMVSMDSYGLKGNFREKTVIHCQ
jgi:hypothetical protein